MAHEVPYTSIVVSDIVQQFIREIGIPTIERFDRCAKLLWKTAPYSGPIPPPYPIQPTSPIASPPGSSVFTFYGKQARAEVFDSNSDDAVFVNSHRREQPLIPHTPERTLSSQLSKTLTPKSYISPTRTSRHSNSLSSARSPVTPNRLSPKEQYAAFIDENGLTDFFPAIDLVRRMVVIFNWKEELLILGISQDLVAGLMSAMYSYSETERPFSSESPFG